MLCIPPLAVSPHIEANGLIIVVIQRAGTLFSGSCYVSELCVLNSTVRFPRYARQLLPISMLVNEVKCSFKHY